MYACICRAVTERTVSAAIAAGACSVDDLAAGCGAGSRCGACLPSLHRLLGECLGLTPSAPTAGSHPTPRR
ncbi:MAG: (2Fe-2S)-binding protein [Actinomycetota bacterium]|nr:(2Fe-2S)-binding protein [Actinomycetota bacterium]